MSGAEALLREQGFTQIQPAAEEWTNALRLRAGAIEAWLAPRLMIMWAWREALGDPDQLTAGQVVRQSEIWFAGSPGIEPEIAALWSRRFEELRADGSYQRLLDRYLRLRPEPMGGRPRYRGARGDEPSRTASGPPGVASVSCERSTPSPRRSAGRG